MAWPGASLRAKRRERVTAPGRVTMNAAEAAGSGNLVVAADGVSKAFGERFVVRDFSTRVIRGDRMVLGGCNFGVLLPWWDMLFGTANFELRYDPTGIRDQVEQGRDYGHGFWSQQWLGLQRLLGHG